MHVCTWSASKLGARFDVDELSLAPAVPEVDLSISCPMPRIDGGKKATFTVQGWSALKAHCV